MAQKTSGYGSKIKPHPYIGKKAVGFNTTSRWCWFNVSKQYISYSFSSSYNYNFHYQNLLKSTDIMLKSVLLHLD